MLILTPFFVFWARTPMNRWPWQRWAEAIAALAVVAAVGYVVFAGPVALRNYPLTFLPFPPLLWIAIRFPPRETTTAIVGLSLMAVVGTFNRIGPFGRGTLNESILLLQAFLGVMSVASLALAAESSRRRAIEAEVLHLNVDLTERVTARTEELQRLHGRLVEAQHVAHVGSWEWDIRQNAVWWSEELYRIYGLPMGTPVAYEEFLDLVYPDDRAMVATIIRRSLETIEPFAFEHRIVRAEGAIRTVSAQGRVVTSPDGTPVRMMGTSHDITDRKEAEEKRLELLREQAARREAEESNRMKDHFLATLSHELRTPLNAVLGWAQILRNAPSDERLRGRAIDAISRNVSVQAQLVSDILDVARIRAGALRIEPHALTLTKVLNAALEIVTPMMASKQIEVTISVSPDADVIVGDEHRLQQVFWNLLSNAAKFAPVRGHVRISGSVCGDSVEVTVEDDGPGIDQAFLPHVFEQFRQADGSLTREHGGLGLGLAISYHLVQMHNGAMTAANRPQGGAIFTVRLPAQRTAA